MYTKYPSYEDTDVLLPFPLKVGDERILGHTETLFCPVQRETRLSTMWSVYGRGWNEGSSETGVPIVSSTDVPVPWSGVKIHVGSTGGRTFRR